MLIDTTMFMGACYLAYELVNKIDPGSIIASKFKKKSNYCLTLGHTKGILKRDIVVDFRITPHLLVAGLSGQGKSRCVESAVASKKNVTILNAYSDDFTSVKNARRIIGNDKILRYLNNLLENPIKRKEEDILFLVIDEMLVLCSDKKITKAITDLLAIGRHLSESM